MKEFQALLAQWRVQPGPSPGRSDFPQAGMATESAVVMFSVEDGAVT